MNTQNGEVIQEFPRGKEMYCPRCYFDDDITVLRDDCKHSQEVTLAPEGTPLAVFQKERTDAISEMFDNKYSNDIYPTSHLFARLDSCVEMLLTSRESLATRAAIERAIAVAEDLEQVNNYSTMYADYTEKRAIEEEAKVQGANEVLRDLITRLKEELV